MAEMICDQIAASKTYKGKNWTNSSNLEYWLRTEKDNRLNPKLKAMVREILDRVSQEGVNKVIKPKVLKEAYNRYVNKEEEKEYKHK